jgi:hypothetical protein
MTAVFFDAVIVVSGADFIRVLLSFAFSGDALLAAPIPLA